MTKREALTILEELGGTLIGDMYDDPDVAHAVATLDPYAEYGDVAWVTGSNYAKLYT